MSKLSKIILKIINGTQDKNIKFDELCYVLDKLEFKKRINGAHHIYYKDGIDEIINIQPVGSLSKPYQVKQVRNIIIKYKLGNSDE